MFIHLFIHFWLVSVTSLATLFTFEMYLLKKTSGCAFCEFTSALNVPSLSAARAPRAHTDSAKTVCLQNRQRRLLCEEDFREQEEEEEEEGAMVGTAGRSAAVC